MTPGNPFFRADPSVPGGFLLSAAGLILFAADAACDDDTAPEGVRCARDFIDGVLSRARSAGYTRCEVAETLLLREDTQPDRRQQVALELADVVGGVGVAEAMRAAGPQVQLDGDNERD